MVSTRQTEWCRVDAVVYMRQRQWCKVVHNRARAAPIFIRARIRTHTHTHTRQGPRSLRVVDIAFFDDGRCSYASNRAGLDGPYAPPRHGHDTRKFGWSRIPLDLQGRQVCLSVRPSLCLPNSLQNVLGELAPAGPRGLAAVCA